MAAEIGGNGLWSSRPIEVIVRHGDEVVAERTLAQPFARVGDHPGCEVVLADAGEPGCQLYLHATDEGIFCLGLAPGTPNGWVGDKSYAPLGVYRVYAQFADDGPPPIASADDLRKPKDDSANWPRIVVRGSHGNRVKHRLPGRLTLVGRNRRSTVRFDDDTVSDAHCVLFWDGRTCWVIDLFAAGGTLLDGRRLSAQAVPAGHELLIGNNRVHWRPGQETPEAVAELHARLAQREQQSQELARALGEREAEVARLTAELQRQAAPAVAEQVEQARKPAATAAGPSVNRGEEVLPEADGRGLLGEELIERLLDFKSKREGSRLRRRLLWTVAAAFVLLSLGAVATVVARPSWLWPIWTWPGEPPAHEYPASVSR